MSRTNPHVETFVTSIITAMVEFVGRNGASDTRARFTVTGSHKNEDNLWLNVDQLGPTEPHDTMPEKVWIHTNDVDLMVGSRPSFSISMPPTEAASLVEETCRFIVEKFGDAHRLEVLLQATALPGRARIPNFVGNSEDGFEALSEQFIPDIA